MAEVGGVGAATDPTQRRDLNHPQVVIQPIGTMFESDRDPLQVAGEPPSRRSRDARNPPTR